MRIIDLIHKKRRGDELSADEVKFLVAEYTAGGMADYQMSAFTMAVCFQGMTPAETAVFARAMMESGDVYNLDEFAPAIPVDKHSTGGVGDKVSLVLAPLAAVCGALVPMVSGRGLGHSGGTLDKLESIPGFDVNLSPEQYTSQLRKLGLVMVGQSESFVPADRKLYALRDVTATVESIPLICGSILSKKAASGAKALVMDVKCGSGAFMDNQEDATELARALQATGRELGMTVRALITDMNQPLGDAVGNSLEVLEAIECMRGGGPDDFRRLTLALTSEMLVMANLAPDLDAALVLATEKLDSGAALERFIEMVEAQSGDTSVIDDPAKLDISKDRTELRADRAGVVSTMNCREVGNAAILLGAGRNLTTDDIDPGVGLIMRCQIGQPVKEGDVLAEVVHRNNRGLQPCLDRLRKAIVIEDTPPFETTLILDRL